VAGFNLITEAGSACLTMAQSPKSFTPLRSADGLEEDCASGLLERRSVQFAFLDLAERAMRNCLALIKRDFAAATEIPANSATSHREISSEYRISVTLRRAGGKRQIAALTNSSFSRSSK
jgi:hypothetical protein